jgi:hypothetical protein
LTLIDLCFVRWLSILSRAITRNVDIYIVEAILDTGVYYRQSGLLSNLAKAYSDKQRMRLRDIFRNFDSDYKQTITKLAEETELPDIADLLTPSRIAEDLDEIGLFAFGF